MTDTVKLKPAGLFHTPKSMDELMKWCEQLNGSERVVAMTVMGMTWNLCAELVNGKKSLNNLLGD